MTELTLNSLVVENFRSIRGEVVVALNAPVVLIHGPNGTGKSSLMTALALALAGPEIADLPDPKHLVHHGAAQAQITLGTSLGRSALRITPGDKKIGPGILDTASAGFFAERCYLEQTKLTQLLDLYERPTKGNSESALTRFVKELLRLDELDALIGGLRPAGDVRRVEGELPVFKAWRSEQSPLAEKLEKLSADQKSRATEISALESELGRRISDLGAGPKLDEETVAQLLEQSEDLVKVARLDALRKRLEELARAESSLESLQPEPSVVDAEALLYEAQERRSRWQEAHGRALTALIENLRSQFPGLASPESVSPKDAWDQAFERVQAEHARLEQALARDQGLAVELAHRQQTIEEAQARLTLLNYELSDENTLSTLGDLSRVLAELTGHVSDDICPVCGRDFGEVADEPLATHLASEVARLSARAGQLQSAAKARLETTADLQREEEAASRLRAQRLSAERRADAETLLKQLNDLSEQLRAHDKGASEGAAIVNAVRRAEASLSRARASGRAYVAWREELDELRENVTSELMLGGSDWQIAHLIGAIADSLERLRARRSQRADMGELWDALIKTRSSLQLVEDEKGRLEALQDAYGQAVSAVERRTVQARELLHHAEAIRRRTIAGVFNSALNTVWADLFVRLAPDEEYVPAFAEPAQRGPVTAEFETRRRDGSSGGKPSEMLSAGNLNTAALTLFLALHLSVQRRVPWLLLDDPVQSMDEVHVAQFAGLLRTLTQQEPQRKVIIAVHERALFEYLTLELSPATPDARLQTIELRRERDGASTVLPTTWVYKPDTALSAAS